MIKKLKNAICVALGIIAMAASSPEYFSSINDFLQFSQSGEAINAQIISKKQKSSRGVDSCVLQYRYMVNGIKYSGEDKLSESCPSTDQVKVFYVVNTPDKSAIGFYINLILFPIFFIILTPLSICRRLYMNKCDKKTFLKLDLAYVSLMFILSSATIIYSLTSPLAYKGVLSSLVTGMYIIFGFYSGSGIYKYMIKHNLYANGKKAEAVIINITPLICKGNVIGYKIYYDYTLGGSKYSADDALNIHEYPSYQVDQQIPILYHPHKKHISCITL
jgi:hypothetical protein